MKLVLIMLQNRTTYQTLCTN